MKVVILCGGLGTRLSEETTVKPKPMVEIGGYPIVWHIMNIYSSHGFKEFVLALGYKGDVIKEYFLNYYHHSSNLTIDLASGKVTAQKTCPRDWRVHLVDTGTNTMTGGRVRRLKDIVGDETFMLTYGDGVSNVDIAKLAQFHRSHGKLATVTAVRPSARFGGMVLDGDGVKDFKEKPQTGEGWINGGFFVFEPKVLDYIAGDETVLEAAPLETLARDAQLMAHRHDGFWQCMDTVRDRDVLNRMWKENDAPWDPSRKNG